MNNAERWAFANAMYRERLKRVKNTPEPAGQKFPIGGFVRIADDLGECMDHFRKSTYAMVEHTYDHAYGCGDVESYSLLVRNADGTWGSSSWYKEWQLTLVDDPKIIEELKKEIERL
jgi:hypothetical protein